MKVTFSQIREAIKKDNKMIAYSPNRGIFYFYGGKDRKGRVLNNLSSRVFYDFCKSKNAYGCYEIYSLLINREIPMDIVKFYIENENGGCWEVAITKIQYGIGTSQIKSLEELEHKMIEMDPEDKFKIKSIFEKVNKDKELLIIKEFQLN